MNGENREWPEWIRILSDEDLQFLKRLVLASGSLKSLAQEYGVSYPTIRIRLDRLIEKIKTAESPVLTDEFHRQLQLMVVDGVLASSTAKQLLKTHNETIQAVQRNGEKNDES